VTVSLATIPSPSFNKVISAMPTLIHIDFPLGELAPDFMSCAAYTGFEHANFKKERARLGE
jgi:hypothetical protein